MTPDDYDPTDSDAFRAAVGQYVLERIEDGGTITNEQIEVFRTWFRLGFKYGESE